MCQNKKESILKQNSIHDLLFLQNTKIYQTYSREIILLCQRLPIIWDLPLFHVGPLFAFQRLHWRGIRNRVESFKAHTSFLREPVLSGEMMFCKGWAAKFPASEFAQKFELFWVYITDFSQNSRLFGKMCQIDQIWRRIWVFLRFENTYSP